MYLDFSLTQRFCREKKIKNPNGEEKFPLATKETDDQSSSIATIKYVIDHSPNVCS